MRGMVRVLKGPASKPAPKPRPTTVARDEERKRKEEEKKKMDEKRKRNDEEKKKYDEKKERKDEKGNDEEKKKNDEEKKSEGKKRKLGGEEPVVVAVEGEDLKKNEDGCLGQNISCYMSFQHHYNKLTK